MRRLVHDVLFLLVIILAASCQKGVVEESDDENVGADKVLVNFSISQIEQVPFDLASYKVRASEVNQVCSHIFFAVYSADGKKVASKSQKSSDSDFGKLSASLERGNYRVVILAYNSDENPNSSTSADKITFGNNGKMSDTFLWSEDVAVNDNLEKSVTLKRVVAVFRLKTTDNVPSNVAKIKFNYTGGSSTISALTGAGNAKSRQEEVITPVETGKPGTFEVYTFPREDESVLKIDVAALDANDNTVVSRTFENVPITRNKVTQYTGEFFKDGGTGSGKALFNITVDETWDSTIERSF